jgi:RES domain
MDRLFSQLTLADTHRDLIRNIVSIRSSQDLFDDLTNEPSEWALAQQVEDSVKPPPYQSRTPIIHRPFEDAAWVNAIAWPFKHWQASRFSDGSFGVWYGCDTAKTSVYETAYHWFRGFLSDAGFDKEPVIGERKLYEVRCDAALLDLRPAIPKHADLLHKTDYSTTQMVGARLHREGHPGLITLSARSPTGHNIVVMNPAVLSNPRDHCLLTYRLAGSRIIVEREAGVTWMSITTTTF